MPDRKLGRAPTDPHKLRTARSMEHYLIASNLPKLPASTNWRSKMTEPLGPMLNDQIGDCVIATQGHALQCFTSNAREEYTPPDSEILAAYQAVTGAEGAAFDPQTGANDNGCQLSDGIDYMIQVGLAGHKFLAKLSLNPQNFTSLKYAIYLFGCAMIGVSLTPETLQSTDTWDIPRHVPFWRRHQYTPNPAMGHAIAVVDYNADGSIVVASWGQFFIVTSAWQAACLDEAWVPVAVDWANEGGLAPNMIDMKSLQADLALITNV